MGTTAGSDRPTSAARRAGYLLTLAVNVAMLYAVNAWPGWESVPFLTNDAVLVLGLVNASIAVSIAANLVYLAADPRWLKGLGDALTTAVGLAALLQIWRVFPFDFPAGSIDWALVTRILLGAGMFGSCIAIISELASVAMGLTVHAVRPGSRRP